MSYREKKWESKRKRNRRNQDRRRAEAIERQEMASKRSVATRLERLDSGGYAAIKERTKLSHRED